MTTLVAAADSLSFDTQGFAFSLSLTYVPIQRRFLEIVVAYFDILAQRSIENIYVDDEDLMLIRDGEVIAKALSILK